jgi:hypothetical protein
MPQPLAGRPSVARRTPPSTHRERFEAQLRHFRQNRLTVGECWCGWAQCQSFGPHFAGCAGAPLNALKRLTLSVVSLLERVTHHHSEV